MKTEWEFIDENGSNLTGIIFLEPGDRVINVNGEWVCNGSYDSVTIETREPNLIEKIFGFKKIFTGETHCIRRYIMRRIIKNDK